MRTLIQLTTKKKKKMFYPWRRRSASGDCDPDAKHVKSRSDGNVSSLRDIVISFCASLSLSPWRPLFEARQNIDSASFTASKLCRNETLTVSLPPRSSTKFAFSLPDKSGWRNSLESSSNRSRFVDFDPRRLQWVGV